MQRLLLALIFLLVCGQNLAAEHYNPFDDWQTLESEHLTVTFKPEQEAIARDASSIAETILPQLEEFFSWSAKDKIHITLSDQQDRANGYASPLPYNRVVLYTPSPDGLSAIQDYDAWFETLIIHELTHVIHLDKARDWSLFPRYIFGRNFLTFPNLFQPSFFKEGIATYIETSWENQIGRGQNTYYDMVLRTEAASGILPLSKAQQNVRDWPLDKAYSYGVPFYQFLDERYGQASIQNYIETFSGQLVPFIVDRPARHNTNQTGLTELWSEYASWLQARYEQQISALLAGTLTKPKQLTVNGYFNDSPLVSPSGDIYFVSFDSYAPTMVVKHSAIGDQKALFRIHTGSKLVGLNQEKLYYLQQNHCTHNSLSYDLYAYDLLEHSTQQLSVCAHFIEGEVHEGTLLAVKADNNRKHLVQFDIEKRKETLIIHGTPNVNFASPTWLDENTIAFSEKSAGKRWRIQLLELNETSNVEVLNIDKSNNRPPNNAPKTILQTEGINYYEVKAKRSAGKPEIDELLITSDDQNVIEVWVFSLLTKNLDRLTQTLTGSTQARYNTASNTLVYRAYTENGWNIHEAPYSPIAKDHLTTVSKPKKPGQGFEANWSMLESFNNQYDIDSAEQTQAPTTDNYSSLDTLAPQSWFFGFVSDNAQTTLSLMVDGRDELNFHNWSLIGGRDLDNELNTFQASYTAYNHLTLLYSRDYDYTLGDNNSPAGFQDKARFIETREDFAALAHTTMHFDFSSLFLFAGGNQQERDLNDLASPTDLGNIRVKTAGVGGLFDSTYSALYGISPSHGRRILAVAEQDFLVGSNANVQRAESDGEAWSIDWFEYIPLYQAHTLALRAFHGYASEGADPFDLGDGPSFSAYEQNLIHRRGYPMRGYPDQTQELIGTRPRLYSADYRFPLIELDEGLASWPLGMKNLHGAVFYESGRAQSSSDYFDSAGAEITLNLDIGFGLLPVGIRAGFAQPFSETAAAPEKDTNYYFGFGYSL
jgi:Tol biopolymer transport system component